MKDDQLNQIDNLIRTKSYQELTTAEQALVEELIGDEQAYQQYQQLVSNAHESVERKVSANVSDNLYRYFKEKNRPAWYSLFNYRIPAYVHLAMMALILSATWWWTTSHPNLVEVTREVYLPGKTDTLLVQLPPDTIVIEKIIQKTIPVYITDNVTTERKTAKTEGSSLAEQQDLTEFLVSGK